jgi:hypothetical protein
VRFRLILPSSHHPLSSSLRLTFFSPFLYLSPLRLASQYPTPNPTSPNEITFRSRANVPTAPQKPGEKTSASTSISPIVYARGIRDVTYGLLYLSLEATNAAGTNDKALNIFSAIVCLTAFVDGYLVHKYGGEKLAGKKWGHWGMIGGLGAWVAWRVGVF